MPDYQVAFNVNTKVATVQTKGDALPSGSVKAGVFHHPNPNDILGPAVNHVTFHHVQDVLYRWKGADPLGWQNMQIVKIEIDTNYVALSGITIAPATVTLSLAGTTTQQLSVTPDPANASNPDIATWVSSDPTKATVSDSGLVTAVAIGTTTITATSVDGAKTATRLITVNA